MALNLQTFIERNPDTAPIFAEARRARRIRSAVRKQQVYFRLKGRLYEKTPIHEHDTGTRLLTEEMGI